MDGVFILPTHPPTHPPTPSPQRVEQNSEKKLVAALQRIKEQVTDKAAARLRGSGEDPTLLTTMR